MNFKFVVGDEVEFNPYGRRGPKGLRLVLVKEFVQGIFHARNPEGAILRVRTSELVRLRRPSDEVRRVEIEKRKEQKRVELQARKERIDKNREKFEYMEEFRVRLTAAGLPDKRCKPKFSAKNSPQTIKPRGRSNLL